MCVCQREREREREREKEREEERRADGERVRVKAREQLGIRLERHSCGPSCCQGEVQPFGRFMLRDDNDLIAPCDSNAYMFFSH